MIVRLSGEREEKPTAAKTRSGIGQEYSLAISSNHGAVNQALLDGPPKLAPAPLLVPIKFDHAPTVLS
jgi:hypothetical protein